MFANTFNYLKSKLIKTEQKEEQEEQPVEKIPNEILLQEIDYSGYGEPKITNPDKDKTVLIVDDYDLTNVLFTNDFKTIHKEFQVYPEEDFRIIRCICVDAGFQAYKAIAVDKLKIDFALLDLTLGNLVRLPNGEFADIDGAELAIALKKVNPDAKILFVSAHTTNKNNATVAKYSKKLEKYGIDLHTNYCSKNDINRHKLIYNLLYK